VSDRRITSNVTAQSRFQHVAFCAGWRIERIEELVDVSIATATRRLTVAVKIAANAQAFDSPVRRFPHDFENACYRLLRRLCDPVAIGVNPNDAKDANIGGGQITIRKGASGQLGPPTAFLAAAKDSPSMKGLHLRRKSADAMRGQNSLDLRSLD
jgi:hypothetical protein